MAKIKKVIFGLFLAMFAVVALSSCNKDNDDKTLASTPETEQMELLASARSNTVLRANGWSEVSRYIQNSYYEAYFNAAGGHPSFMNQRQVQYAPNAIGFYAALNATYSKDWVNQGEETLKTLCEVNSGYAHFGNASSMAYTSSDKRYFILDVKNFVSQKAKPVVIYAATNPWGPKRLKGNILTVWKVSDTKVVVTRMSDIPNRNFSRNYLIELTWDELFQKGLDISSNSPKVVNVAYIDSSI